MSKYIHKAAGIIIRNRKLLVEQSFGKDFYISPGGSIEPGETAKQALVRELMEEFSIIVRLEDCKFFESFEAAAANHPDKIVKMDVFMVHDWQGEPEATSEVESIAWIMSDYGDLPLGSIFAKKVIPRLVALNLID